MFLSFHFCAYSGRVDKEEESEEKEEVGRESEWWGCQFIPEFAEVVTRNSGIRCVSFDLGVMSLNPVEATWEE